MDGKVSSHGSVYGECLSWGLFNVLFWWLKVQIIIISSVCACDPIVIWPKYIMLEEKLTDIKAVMFKLCLLVIRGRYEVSFASPRQIQDYAEVSGEGEGTIPPYPGKQ